MIDNVVKILLIMLVLLTHELGHYFKFLEYNVRVRELSIGIGPRIFKKRLRNGVFSIRLIPIVAYVTPRSKFNIKKERNRKRLKKYLHICLAGIKVNFLLGIISFAIYYVIWKWDLYVNNLYVSSIVDYLGLFWGLSIGGGILNLLPLVLTDGAKSLKILLKLIFTNEFLISILYFVCNVTGFMILILLFKFKILGFVL